ncbi:MAG: SDR family oxidoreductase [Dehalococcoidia bacterium]|nr:SDR family oxidoreductase [Dehalococcoidia bacterium]
MEADLSGKVALVTGSSKGIGRAVAIKFAENGASLVINGRTPSPALEVVEHIRAMGREAHFESADLYKYEDVKRMVDSAVQRFGHIDILVASGAAGGPPPQPFQQIDPKSYGDCISSHLFTRLYAVRAVLDHMVSRQSGKIILVTTDAGRTPTKGESLIGGAAAALVLMTKVLGMEFASSKIHINTICTTVTRDTPGYERATSQQGSRMAEIFRKAEERMPFGINKPDDIAHLALFLASKDSDQITGQVFTISGGLTFPG